MAFMHGAVRNCIAALTGRGPPLAPCARWVWRAGTEDRCPSAGGRALDRLAATSTVAARHRDYRDGTKGAAAAAAAVPRSIYRLERSYGAVASTRMTARLLK